MNKIEAGKNPDLCFAAIKLIEQLYRDGKIPAHIFRNILHEHSDVVDEGEFVQANNNKTEERV